MTQGSDVEVLRSEEVAAILREMAPRYVPELDLAGTTGPEAALVSVFSHLVEEALQRLGRVPERCFIAFLEMLGIQLRPAGPARVPVTFVPAEGLATGALVPERTRVATRETSDRPIQTFETETGFVASRTTLGKIIGSLPERDQVYHHTADVLAGREFAVWRGVYEQEHVLVLGHDKLFALRGAATISLSFRLTRGSSTDLLEPNAVWEYRDRNGKVMKLTGSTGSREATGQIALDKGLGEIGKTAFEGRLSRWIRCRLKKAPGRPPRVAFTQVQIDNVAASDIRPDSAYYNSIPLDLSGEFLPFGGRPRIYDAFYLGSREVFSKSRATVKLEFTIATSGRSGAGLTWEYWNGSVWKILGLEIDFQTVNVVEAEFACPDDVADLEVNGETNFWIRARITSGDYGRERFKRSADGAWELDTSELMPPVLSSVTLSYSLSEEQRVVPEHVLTRNHGEVRDLTVENGVGTAELYPFRAIPETEPVLHLGFSKPFQEGNASVFVSIRERDVPVAPVEFDWSYWQRTHDLASEFAFTNEIRLVSSCGIDAGAMLLIEEATEAGTVVDVVRVKEVAADGLITLADRLTARFTRTAVVCRRTLLQISDHTEGLTRSGSLEFVAPASMYRTHQFGESAFWIMGSVAGQPDRWEPPSILGIHLNTVWAEQMETIRDELLGSGDGGETLEYSFLRRPVQRQDIWVMHGQTVPEQELEGLSAKDVRQVRDEEGRLLETWIRWEEVKGFLGSGPTDRHYVLDRAMGTVLFGDGMQGKAVPAGRDNIRADYRTGGGVRGNVGTGEIAKITTSVAGIDRVFNAEPAEGGADTELVSEVLERGPHVLRHRERAVTTEDYERMARATSNDIARTKCFTEGARIVVIVVPKGHGPRPMPSQRMKRLVKERLQALSSPALRPEFLAVAGPDYVAIRVLAEIVPTSVDRAPLVRKEVTERLAEYLHPLTGGNEGMGWAFGREVRDSDVYALLESLPDVDHVASLEMPGGPAELRSSELVCSGEHEVTVIVGA